MLKGVVEPYDVTFPDIPEVGIDDETAAFDAEDIIPVLRTARLGI